MSTAGTCTRRLRHVRDLTRPQWQLLRVGARRSLATESTPTTPTTTSTPSSETTDNSVEYIDGRPRPGIDFSRLKHARPLPVSPSYFSRTPFFNDDLVRLNQLIFKYGGLPTVPRHMAARVPWKRFADYQRNRGEQIKQSAFTLALGKVKRLAAIQPELMPDEVREAVDSWKRSLDSAVNVAKEMPIDRFGRVVAVGRRKTSVARAWVVEGTGEVQINGKSVVETFGRTHDRESAVWPLRVTERLDKYNVWALVEGGGSTGQAEALTMAIAKALVSHEPALKPILRKGKITAGPNVKPVKQWALTCRSSASSRLHYARPQNGGEEETWQEQGQKGVGMERPVSDGLSFVLRPSMPNHRHHGIRPPCTIAVATPHVE